MKLFCSLLSFLLCFTLFSQEELKNFEITETPSWVIRQEIVKNSKVDKYDVSDGYYVNLRDMQTLFETHEDYYHVALKVINESGVSNVSEIDIEYDPTYQTVQFHTLNVIRNGKTQNRLDDVEFKQVNQELDLSEKMYNGNVTAFAVLNDIRKNDILEYAYTVIGDNPIYEGKLIRTFFLQSYNPMDKLYVRITYPKKLTLSEYCNLCEDIKISKIEEGEHKVLTVERTNIEGKFLEDNIPSWSNPFEALYLCEYDNWEDINDWAASVFNVEDDNVEALEKKAEEIKTENKTLEEQILACLNFIQNDIRYMGLENGIGSIKPFAPSKVLEQRFGDCKDKSLLFSKLLNLLGVQDAYPALVSTYYQHTVSEMLPSPGLFNHCIAYFELNGKSFWFDPTNSYQGG